MGIPCNCWVHQITFSSSYLRLPRSVDGRSSVNELCALTKSMSRPHLAGLVCDQLTVPDLQHAIGARDHHQVVGHHQCLGHSFARLASRPPECRVRCRGSQSVRRSVVAVDHGRARRNPQPYLPVAGRRGPLDGGDLKPCDYLERTADPQLHASPEPCLLDGYQLPSRARCQNGR